jgi:hypothetical protein
VSEANGHADAPPSPPGRWLQRVTVYALATGLAVATVLRLVGLLDAEWFWAVVTGVILINFTILVRLNNQLFADLDAAYEHVIMASSILSSFKPVVRCAGCHTAAYVKAETDEHGFFAPPGWNVVNERPYCPSCLPT